MEKTTIHLHTQFQISEVDERIFGGFAEHLGRCIYEGLYDPQSTTSDKDGFRKDVMSALAKLDMPVMRWPGGNFVSGYHWLDGVGPKDQRQPIRDLAWQCLEPNLFGTDEFMAYCKKIGWSPMLAVNLGTGTPEEARNWVEYCNSPAGTKYSNMRAANGHEEPYGVKLWCLGNEMDGQHQLGHVPARDYAIRAQQAAKMMKDVDPEIELVLCGSCSTNLPTYGSWDMEVLEYTWDFVDYISTHRYTGNSQNDTAEYLAATDSFDRQIRQMSAFCQSVQAKLKSDKQMFIAFDEWNVWYKATGPKFDNGHGKCAQHLLEEYYNMEDALAVAGFLNSFVRNADVVKIANLAQVVNVIAPLLTDGDKMLVQSIYYPFEMMTKRRRGVSLQQSIVGPTYDSTNFANANYIDSSVICGDSLLHVFATNRSMNENAEVEINLADREILGIESAEIISHNDPKAQNTFDQPDIVTSRNFEAIDIKSYGATITLPPLSFAAVSFKI